MDAGGSCSALDDDKTTLGYRAALRATGRHKFPCFTMKVAHIRERLPNKLATVVRMRCFHLTVVSHVTQKLLELSASFEFIF